MTTSIETADEDTIRICVATDCHLGYAEGDAVRGNDSFAALEEILFLARHYECDMVLLAGDLFHENKPSRRTMYKAMTIFRNYCMGPNPIRIQVLGDESALFRQGQVNYRNPFYSVDLPVMSIHGNHDDPSREGTELYAALDLLDCANLVNYIGRQEEISHIEVSPILMQKGSTHLALYALGSMRDERLHRMWQSNNLKFLRPEQSSDPSAPQFFNLFALHQNRDRGRGTKNCIQETMIPEWMDLVCWGHEHECCIEPQESVVGTFRITQPGSSVATSLVPGEATRKHIGILDVRGQAFRLAPIPLTQVRSFTLGELSLADHRLDPEDPKIEQKIKQILMERVEVLVHDATEKRQELEQAAKDNANVLASLEQNPLSNQMDKPEEVLVRLKVEHAGFAALNNQRFGAHFVGKVANVTDILLFSRKKATSTRAPAAVTSTQPIAPDVLEEMNIEDLVVQELDLPDRKLELLDEKRIATALNHYVEKQQAQAISEVVTTLLGKQQSVLIRQGNLNGPTNRGVSEEGNEAETPVGRAPPDDNMEQDDIEDDDEEESVPVRPPSPPKRSNKRALPRRSQSDEDNRQSQAPAPARRRRAVTKTAVSYNDSSDEESMPKSAKAVPTTRKRKPTNYSLDEDSDDFEVASKSSSRSKRQPQRRTTKNSKASTQSFDLDDDWGDANTDPFD
eukprot:Nitzschia sp. Nitz4//scaffold12_size214221//6885//9013//NITZ4_001473-RA/size214221-augustus-gene-0.17-mRNA-1//-1//CDS//3329534939//4415//frame0